MNKNSFATAFFESLKSINHVYFGLDEHKLAPSNINTIPLLMSIDDFNDFVDILKSNESIEHFKISSKYDRSSLNISLKCGAQFNVLAKHSFKFDKLTYLEAEEVYNYAVTTPSGITIPSAEHRFEYAIINSFLNNKSLDEKHFHYFEGFHVLMQEDLVDYFNNKYKTSFHSLYSLLLFNDLDRLAIFDFIKTLPSNRFIKQINIRWNRLKGNFKQAK